MVRPGCELLFSVIVQTSLAIDAGRGYLIHTESHHLYE